jgi:hypothetical protein
MMTLVSNAAAFLFVLTVNAVSGTWIQQPMTRIVQRRNVAKRTALVQAARPSNCVACRQSSRYLLKLPDEEDIDNFLDTPFYDPDRVLDDEESSEASKKFAMFVKNDYETAEALLAGAFFVVLVVVAQELLRHHIYGSSYVPFTSVGSVGGRLF